MECNPTTLWQTSKVRLSVNLHRMISFSLIRLSSTYLKNERMKLSKQRNLLRIIQNESQTHYSSDKIFLNHLPSSIPSAIPIGSRVIGKFALYSKTHTDQISSSIFSSIGNGVISWNSCFSRRIVSNIL